MVAICGMLALSMTSAEAADDPGGSTSLDTKAATFEGQVLPVLSRYCANCHGTEKPKAGLDLTAFAEESSVARSPKVWESILEHVEGRVMPPEDRPQPTEAELVALTGWIEAELERGQCGGPVDPGRVTIRRLNRAEYAGTIRDLIGIEFRMTDDFPSDDVGYGFDNIGDVLSMPPILLEKYMAAAERIVAQAIVAELPWKGTVQSWEAEDLGKAAGGIRHKDVGRVLGGTGEIRTTATLHADGAYFLRVKAFGQQAGTDPARMAIRVDGETIGEVDVPAVEGAPGTYEVRFEAKAGPRRLAFAFLNDFYQGDAPPSKRDRNLVIDAIEVQGPFVADEDHLPESHRRILFRPAQPGDGRDRARAILERFTERAYRRPVDAEEVDRLAAFVDLAVENGDTFELGIQLAVQAVLVSPQFLFRVELDRGAGAEGEVHPIGDFELATRLSYFLWSSMPDQVLFELARRGTLHLPEVLEAQVRRMLADPKAGALVENFAGQWLQTRNLKTFSPDRKRFPQFDEALRAAMLAESELFFRAILEEDRSILDFLDADFTFLNERLARHYEIAGVEGDEFRRVALSGDRRGGLLTQAAILTITSNPTRTSPVKRGKWILEQILGTPPPPPPPDVPELGERRRDALTGTLRQRMEQHRSDPNCTSCHSRMDPLGFGFENYDAIGAWRDFDGKFPVDPSGKLPAGAAFQGPKELKAILKAKEKDFARCLAEKMLTYALGRGLERPDRCVVDQIVDAMGRDGYRSTSLVLGIVKSDPFLKRSGKGGGS